MVFICNCLYHNPAMGRYWWKEKVIKT